MTTASQRLLRALAGDVVAPPVRGISFVDPSVLPAPAGDVSGAAPLVAACAELRLDFAFVPWWQPWARDAVAALVDAGIAPLAVVDGVLWPALERVGFETGMRQTLGAGGELLAAMDDARDASLATAREAVAAGAAALVIADDLAGASGPLVAPAFLVEHVLPRLGAIAAPVRDADIPVLLHCDGDVRSLLPALAATGFAAVHGDFGGPAWLDDSLAVARRMGIALAGGIPASSLGSLAAAALAGTMASTLAAGGGLLVADDGGVETREQAAALLSALAAAAR